MEKIFKKLLRLKTLPLKSTGQSMLPILRPNDIVYFKKTPFLKIKVNDLIIFKKKNQLITHRVIYKTKKYLITKGDNNPNSDDKIYPKQILGKVYQIKRNGQIFKPETFYLIQSTHYFSEIIKIKKEFDKENINYVFLKGLPLHLYFEVTHPKRLYADCDFLIDKKDFQKAEEILLKNHYQKAELHWSKTAKKMQKKELEATFYKKTNQFIITFDIHLQLVDLSIVHLGHFDELYPQKLIDNLTEKFLKTKRKIKINNEPFLILDTYYLILYLALHLFHHNFTGAFRYDFLDKVIKKSKISIKSWQEIALIIKKYQLNNFVFPVFFLLKKYYKTSVPPLFIRSIQPVNPLTRKLINKLTKINIFNDEPRIRAGIKRFLYLFIFSPSPFWKKILIIFNPQVIFAVFWVVWKKIKNYFWIKI
jgi:signal peptidase I